jgi:hypothetical protein
VARSAHATWLEDKTIPYWPILLMVKLGNLLCNRESFINVALSNTLKSSHDISQKKMSSHEKVKNILE